jgi:hypothetical protein
VPELDATASEACAAATALDMLLPMHTAAVFPMPAYQIPFFFSPSLFLSRSFSDASPLFVVFRIQQCLCCCPARARRRCKAAGKSSVYRPSSNEFFLLEKQGNSD